MNEHQHADLPVITYLMNEEVEQTDGAEETGDDRQLTLGLA